MALIRRTACRRMRLARKRPALLPPSLPRLPVGKTIRSRRPKKSSRATYFLAMLMYSSSSVKILRMSATRMLSAVARGSWIPSA